jgi:hypothetical protein
MRKNKTRRTRKYQTTPSFIRSQGAQLDYVRERATEFENKHPGLACSIVIETSVIDSFILHFKVSKPDALGTVLRHVSVAIKKTGRLRGGYQIKIKNKPIILWVYKQRNWKGENHRVYITMKPTFLITSVEEIADKLAHQAIVNMLEDVDTLGN